MERKPERSRHCFIQAGVCACAFTPLITRPVKRPQRSGALILTGTVVSCVALTGSMAGAVTAAPVSADTSRARPSMPRQSGRFGVSFSSRQMSSRPSSARSGVPGWASAARIIRPSLSLAMPSSTAAQSIPADGTPRTLASLILKSPGTTAPGNAHGTFKPGATLLAPQTIWRGAPSPASTSQTFRRSASGCLVTVSTCPTTTLLNGGATGPRASTSRPAMVSNSARASEDRSGLTNWRSQDSENFMLEVFR